MTTREELVKEFEAGDLDELVHDAKGEEAANINNGGIDAQLDYLLGIGFTLEQIETWLRS